MTTKHVYFALAPSVDVEYKGVPLTIYPQARTGTWEIDLYDGFEDDYNNNLASLVITEAVPGTYSLVIYRSGLNTEDPTGALDLLRERESGRTEQLFETSGNTTEFIVTYFDIKPTSYATIDGVVLSKEKTTISVADNKLVSSDTIGANTEVIIYKN